MTIPHEDVELIEQRYDAREQVARQALELSGGDIAEAGMVIEAAKEFRFLAKFETFVDDIEQFVQYGDVSLERAIEVIYEYDGSRVAARAELDAYPPHFNEGAKRFGESMRETRSRRSSSNIGASKSGVRCPERTIRR